MLSNKEIRALYGKNAVISRKGPFVLVHLDRPSRATIIRRRREFNPDEFFCPDCPLCQMLKKSGIVVFDDSIFSDEDGSGDVTPGTTLFDP
jgi:hypothetical protein